jgi:hypothetical protein
VEELFRLPEDEQGRLFTGQRRAEFLDHLRTRLAPAPGAEAADQLLGSAVRPSQQLLALAADEVQRREMFRLQDQQQTAYRLVLRALERARRGVTKQAIVVVGGPGSGKSVIALSLLGELSRQGRTVLHATGLSAFTQTLRKVAGKRAPRVKAMFRYFKSSRSGRQRAGILRLSPAWLEAAQDRADQRAREGQDGSHDLADAMAAVSVHVLDGRPDRAAGDAGRVRAYSAHLTGFGAPAPAAAEAHGQQLKRLAASA